MRLACRSRECAGAPSARHRCITAQVDSTRSYGFGTDLDFKLDHAIGFGPCLGSGFCFPSRIQFRDRYWSRVDLEVSGEAWQLFNNFADTMAGPRRGRGGGAPCVALNEETSLTDDSTEISLLKFSGECRCATNLPHRLDE
ncbi:hypothetical protein EVAR_50575_1 [Eumeta japonica]|uniref:Uncharacterized protein n=1 Tax=Eumeta variegata TaxID=151549 RepID=A0A4C1Y6K2_EUMVA|nr:hypothetical protein EVAR_50575_1 [Eumeta japonica]